VSTEADQLQEAGRRLVGQALVQVLLDAATLCRTAEPWASERLLLSDSDEDALCRALFVGAWLEESGRSGRLPPESTLAKLIAVASTMDGKRAEVVVEQLQQRAQDAVPDAVLSDMRMLLELAADSGWGDLRGRTPIVTGPTFSGGHLVGAADGDVIAAGLLVDIKTTVEPSRAKPDDLKQLLGYLLLDTEDAYGLDGIGFYFSRQGLLISWGVEELFQLLGVLKPIDQLRSEFAALSRQSKAAKRERSRADSAPE
jgi:hypothetical protein